VTQGLILLGFLGILVAFGWLRLRRRMGLGVSGKIFMTVLTGFVLIVLTMWAAQHG
jgi:fumarate reductase subunit D